MVYDYIVVGAGIAGCFCAAELRYKSKKVLILEAKSDDSRKVCGDGINRICLEILEKMNFPVSRFEDAGALRIYDFYYYSADGVLDHKHDDIKFAYTLNRGITDKVVRNYIENDLEVQIIYNYKVNTITKVDGLFRIGDFCAKRVIIAVGAMNDVRFEDELIIEPNVFANRPVGISMIVRGKNTHKPFMMFDCSEKYKGSYGWIFSLNDSLYNVGVWLKTDKERIYQYLDEFIDERANEYLGSDYSIVHERRTALLACGEVVQSSVNGIFIVGDASNTCDKNTGEGISKAALSAKNLLSSLEG